MTTILTPVTSIGRTRPGRGVYAPLVPQLEVGQLSQQLFLGYMAYAGSSSLLRHPAGLEALERIEAENPGPASVPIEPIGRIDGSMIYFDLSHALREIASGPDYQVVRDRLWLGGALLTLGDALAAHSYFDHGPDLELVRHLRNGVAHGNRFTLRRGEPSRPAHFTGPDRRLMRDDHRTPPGETITFEITSALQGKTVLFDFLGPGDVFDLLQFISVRLIRIGNGDPAQPLFRQRI